MIKDYEYVYNPFVKNDPEQVYIPSPEELDKIENPYIRGIRARGLGVLKGERGTKLPSTKIKVRSENGGRKSLYLPKADESGLGGFTGKAITDVDILNLNFPETEGSDQFHNIHIATGKVAGCVSIFVVDLDVKVSEGVDGVSIFKQWCLDEGIEFPNTYIIESPSGGLHIYFLMPSDKSIHIGNRAKIEVPQQGNMPSGIDVRGHGGQVVAEGSIHKNGGVYKGINDALIAEAHPKIIELVARKSKGKISSNYNGTSKDEDSDSKLDTPDWEILKSRCPAAKLYEDEAENMPQESWALFSGIVARTKNGVELFHQISSRYDGYDFHQADGIVQRSLEPKGAVTCLTISRLPLIGDACKSCRFNKFDFGAMSLSRNLNPIKIALKNDIYIDNIYIVNRGSFYSLNIEDYLRDNGVSALIDGELNVTMSIRKFRADPVFTVVSEVVYDPSTTERFIPRSDGKGFDVNLAPCNEIELVDEIPTLHLKHMEYMFPDQRDRKIVMDFIAFCIKNPGKLMTYGLLIHGNDGIGKSYFEDLFKAILGHRSVFGGKQEALESKYNGWQETASVAVFDEIYAGDRLKAMNKVLSYVGAKSNTIEIKYIPAFNIENRIKYIFFSNDPKPMIIKGGMVRRIAVIDCQNVEKKCETAKMNALNKDSTLTDEQLEKIDRKAHSEYYGPLFDFTVQAGSIKNFYLNEYELVDFDPYEDAPMTEAKQMLMEITADLTEKKFVDKVNSGQFTSSEITTIEDVRQFLRTLDTTLAEAILQADVQLSKLMKKAGMKPIGQRRYKGTRISFWVVKNHQSWQNASVKEIVAEYEKGRDEISPFHSNITRIR